LGVIASAARLVTDDMFMAAAKTLAGLVDDADLRQGSLYPALPRIREVSAEIATSVAKVAFDSGLAPGKPPQNLREYITAQMYDPQY
jgi:malate dehydrogenase (oxaloacetate-decarboxylating)(NADP+)